MCVQGLRGACGAESFANVRVQGGPELGICRREPAKGPRGELAGLRIIMGGEGNELDVGEPGHPDLGQSLSVHVIGNSLGGAVAMQLARSTPE